jgi:hypothetical protein
MKKTIQLCLIVALSVVSLSSFSQTLEEAEAAEKRSDLKGAYAIYRKLADQGDAIAQFNVGFFNQRGQGTPTDYDAAELWYFKSARQGYVKAQENLGWLYVHQKKDIVRGAFWYQKAASQKDANAIAVLSAIYDSHPGLKEKIKQFLETEIEYNKQQILAQQQEKEREAEEERTKKESLICLDRLYEDARTKSLASKMVIDANKAASLEILANTTKPNAKEKVALSYVVAEWERCVDIQAEAKKRILLPEVTQAINSYRLDLRSLFADLYSGKITYGDLAKARAKLDLEFKQQVSSIISNAQTKELADAKRRQEAEAQRRYAEAQNQQQRDAEQQRQLEARRQLDMQEAQMLQAQQQAQQQQQNNSFLQSLQMLQLLNQPRPQPRPNMPVNCTSTRFGSTVTTNCF